MAKIHIVHTPKWIVQFLRQPHILPIAAALFLGPVLGYGVYKVTQTGGLVQYIFVFTLAALFLAIVVSILQRRSTGLVLQDITISIPEFSSFNFVVNNEHKKVAWLLFVETASRVATQPLPHQEGIMREAMDSLYTLFSTTRAALKTMDPSRAGRRISVEVLALSMLNLELRPFLSKWHPILLDFETKNPNSTESDWKMASECRMEMEAMQKRIVKYCVTYGELAGIENTTDFFGQSKDCEE